MVVNRRTYMDIFSDILWFCSKGATKTRILYGCNLNSARLTLHLNALICLGLIEKDGGSLKIVYKTTTHGKRFLKKYVSKKSKPASSLEPSRACKQVKYSNELPLVTSTSHLTHDLSFLSDLYNMEASEAWRPE
jgi:predicted transcriptional regulator